MTTEEELKTLLEQCKITIEIQRDMILKMKCCPNCKHFASKRKCKCSGSDLSEWELSETRDSNMELKP